MFLTGTVRCRPDASAVSTTYQIPIETTPHLQSSPEPALTRGDGALCKLPRARPRSRPRFELLGSDDRGSHSQQSLARWRRPRWYHLGKVSFVKPCVLMVAVGILKGEFGDAKT